MRSDAYTQLFLFHFLQGPENDILEGPCQQLLTLLTLKSATAYTYITYTAQM